MGFLLAVAFLFMISCLTTCAQQRYMHPYYKSYEIITRVNKSLQRLDQNTHNEISEYLKIPTTVNDYSQLASVITVSGLDLAGTTTKHNLRDRTIVIVTSYLIKEAT